MRQPALTMPRSRPREEAAAGEHVALIETVTETTHGDAAG